MNHRKQAFRDRLLQLTESMKLSQAQLAKRAGIEPSHFSRLVRGERPWKREQLERVATAVGLSLAELVQDTEAESLLAAIDAPPDWAEREKVLAANLQEVEGRLAMAEGENRALREELKARPTIEEVDALKQALAAERLRCQQLRAEREGSVARLARFQEALDALRVENAGLRQYGLEMDKYAREASEATTLNYKAATYWKKEAESRGAVLGIGAGFAAIALLAMSPKR